MAALRTALADHILTMPQRFFREHPQTRFDTFFGGSGWVFFLLFVFGCLFFLGKEKIHHIKQQCHFFNLTPCNKPVTAAPQKGDVQIPQISFISETGYFYSFLTPNSTLRHVSFC